MLNNAAEGASRPSCPPSAAPPPASSGGDLAITQNTFAARSSHERNLSRFAAKWAAANLLNGHDEKLAKRISHCGYVARAFDVTLERNGGTGKAGFDGLKSCSSVWCCPCCSPRISAKRKTELDALLSGARASGLSVVLLTLTARHDRRTVLQPFLDALKAAKQKLRRRRDWAALPFAGSVTATEVTFGANGPHPHFHEIILLDCQPSEAVGHIERLRSGWLACLAAVGLSGNDAAFHVQPAQAVGSYVAKFGGAEEIALQGNKRGRNGSRSPWQLLDDARDGDAQAAALWIEYALAFRGRRQLVWSNGLKARFGIDEKPDEELSGEVEPAPDAIALRAWVGSSEAWRQARRRRVALVRAAESGTSLDAAEVGQTDAERWRRLGGDLVIEPG